MNYLGPYLLGPNGTPENGIYTGDARELALAIPDESVDLIFTDPVYQNIDDYRWLAETAARVLKPRSHLIAFFQTNLVREVGNALADGDMPPCWILTSYHRGGPNPRVGIGHTKQKLAFLCLNSALWQHNLVDVIEDVTVPKAKKNHKWQKASRPILKWIGMLTDQHDIVADFFTGGGTVPAVCKVLGRRYLAFEIDPATAEIARQQVRETQPPLFVPEPQQMGLRLANDKDT